MRIAQIAPIVERVPPKKYGGTERVVHALTEELVRRGHDVTLFASGDSQTSGKLASVYPRSIREARLKDIYGMNHWTLLNFGHAYDLQENFDVLHDHVIPSSLPTANLARTPVIATMHGPFMPESKKLFELLRKPGIVTISESQAQPLSSFHHLGTVYNGLDMDHYPFSAHAEDYLLFVGRLSPEKGAHFAIKAAQELDARLILAAKLEKHDEAYFLEHIEPHLSDRIVWIDEVNESERNTLMSKALAFLHPAQWREPFGLTIIEAMACGSPVVAFKKGSIPEIVKSGTTGYVVEDIEDMIQATASIGSISRHATRNHALSTFNVKNMTDGYERMYKKMIDEKMIHLQNSLTTFA